VEGAYSGFGQPIGSFFSPNNPAFVDMTNVIPYDVEKAKALLKEAGVDGLSITIKTPQMAYASRSAELLSAMFAEAGVELKIIPTEFPAKWIEEVFKAKDYDVTIVAHAEPLDIDIFARHGYYFNYKNDKFKALIAEAAKTTDEKARYAKYAEAQKILAEDVPALFLFQLPKLGVWNAKLQGMWENSPIPSNDVTEASWTE
jgi:peptide/nickel transport system substrate-binding protein